MDQLFVTPAQAYVAKKMVGNEKSITLEDCHLYIERLEENKENLRKQLIKIQSRKIYRLFHFLKFL